MNKQTLQRTRSVVQTGWTQGAYQRFGCYCLLGAIHKALDMEAICVEDPRVVAAALMIQPHLPAGYRNDNPIIAIVTFNDSTKQEHVLNALDKAIAAA